MEQLLTIDQVAERLSVSRSTVRTLIYDHRLASVRVGKAVRIRPSAVEDYLATTTWEARQTKAGRELAKPLRDDEKEWLDADLDGPTPTERREQLEDSEAPPFKPNRRIAGREEET